MSPFRYDISVSVDLTICVLKYNDLHINVQLYKREKQELGCEKNKDLTMLTMIFYIFVINNKSHKETKNNSELSLLTMMSIFHGHSLFMRFCKQ